MTAATTAPRAFSPIRPAATLLARWTGFAARFRDTPPSHLLTTAILAVLWSGVFLWRFA
ncbi:hypothetical protein C8J30_10651 [Rhodobacter viridis]|uniref:Uncharacterized protein n=1 Tax=Rhodobacter viridis TaxID=1054202 RepID=A0A318TYL8_9RHOB|nr:hypothetical protein [Rhodobacter viridis]PYF09919.1 hypothetical protein C8J30_10651 [Rhodobacter viridis]